MLTVINERKYERTGAWPTQAPVGSSRKTYDVLVEPNSKNSKAILFFSKQ